MVVQGLQTSVGRLEGVARPRRKNLFLETVGGRDAEPTVLTGVRPRGGLLFLPIGGLRCLPSMRLPPAGRPPRWSKTLGDWQVFLFPP